MDLPSSTSHDAVRNFLEARFGVRAPFVQILELLVLLHVHSKFEVDILLIELVIEVGKQLLVVYCR